MTTQKKDLFPHIWVSNFPLNHVTSLSVAWSFILKPFCEIKEDICLYPRPKSWWQPIFSDSPAQKPWWCFTVRICRMSLCFDVWINPAPRLDLGAVQTAAGTSCTGGLASGWKLCEELDWCWIQSIFYNGLHMPVSVIVTIREPNMLE